MRREIGSDSSGRSRQNPLEKQPGKIPPWCSQLELGSGSLIMDFYSWRNWRCHQRIQSWNHGMVRLERILKLIPRAATPFPPSVIPGFSKLHPSLNPGKASVIPSVLSRRFSRHPQPFGMKSIAFWSRNAQRILVSTGNPHPCPLQGWNCIPASLRRREKHWKSLENLQCLPALQGGENRDGFASGKPRKRSHPGLFVRLRFAPETTWKIPADPTEFLWRAPGHPLDPAIPRAPQPLQNHPRNLPTDQEAKEPLQSGEKNPGKATKPGWRE